jgi:hypothetical protein
VWQADRVEGGMLLNCWYKHVIYSAALFGFYAISLIDQTSLKLAVPRFNFHCSGGVRRVAGLLQEPFSNLKVVE